MAGEYEEEQARWGTIIESLKAVTATGGLILGGFAVVFADDSKMPGGQGREIFVLATFLTFGSLITAFVAFGLINNIIVARASARQDQNLTPQNKTSLINKLKRRAWIAATLSAISMILFSGSGATILGYQLFFKSNSEPRLSQPAPVPAHGVPSAFEDRVDASLKAIATKSAEQEDHFRKLEADEAENSKELVELSAKLDALSAKLDALSAKLDAIGISATLAGSNRRNAGH
jgi:uncharacterized coiled-coil protein SlyX